MKRITILTAILSFALVSCNKEEEVNTAASNEVVLVQVAENSDAAQNVQVVVTSDTAQNVQDAETSNIAQNDKIVSFSASDLNKIPEGYVCPNVNLPKDDRPDWMSIGAGGSAKSSGKSAKPSGKKASNSAMPSLSAGGGGGYGMHQFNHTIPQFNTEEFTTFAPNGFMSVSTSPLSTFGADVDTASYGFFRQSINKSYKPLNLPLRTEEMVNYFKYDYPAPQPGQPFSVTAELAVSPWNPKTKLLQIGIQTAKQEVVPPSNIVFLLDVSGSMCSSERLPLLKDALLNMIPEMHAADRISIVTYAASQVLVLDGASPTACRSQLSRALEGLQCGGYTDGGRGIQMAYEEAEKHFIKGGNNRVILGTDGDLNVGMTSTSELTAFIEKKRDSGIFLSVLGFGTGNYKDNKLEAIADHGNGNYHYIDTILEARKVLIEERESTIYTVAKDAKFQVEFNPAKIKGYRLIGYESRKLNAEDFANDQKDGGEIGSGAQVTILYELVEADSDFEVPNVNTKYQKPQVIESDEWLTINVRYKDPNGTKSKLLSYPVGASLMTGTMSNNMKLASAVAQVAMILNQSEFVGTATYDSILKQLSEISQSSRDPYRDEFIDLVKRLSKM